MLGSPSNWRPPASKSARERSPHEFDGRSNHRSNRWALTTHPRHFDLPWSPASSLTAPSQRRTSEPVPFSAPRPIRFADNWTRRMSVSVSRFDRRRKVCFFGRYPEVPPPRPDCGGVIGSWPSTALTSRVGPSTRSSGWCQDRRIPRSASHSHARACAIRLISTSLGKKSSVKRCLAGVRRVLMTSTDRSGTGSSTRMPASSSFPFENFEKTSFVDSERRSAKRRTVSATIAVWLV